MDAARHLRLAANDGTMVTAERFAGHAARMAGVDAPPALIVLYGEAGAGKSALLRWLAGRFAAEALRPGSPAGTPLVLDLDRKDASALSDMDTGTAHRDPLEWLAARQLGAWAADPGGAFGAPPIWLVDHVDTLAERSVDALLASALRRPGLKVLACSASYWRLTLRPALERGAIYRAPIQVEPFEVVGLPDLPSQRAWIESALHTPDDAAGPLAELLHGHWDLATTPLAIEVATRFARQRGLGELRRELTEAGAGAALLDDYLEALWVDRNGSEEPLGGEQRDMIRQLSRAVLAATDHPTECASGKPLASLHYCGVEDVVQSHVRQPAQLVQTMVEVGFLRVEVTPEGVRYHLPSPSFAARYAVAEPARHPVTPRPSSRPWTYLAQLVVWLLLRPEAWRRHLRAIGDLEPTAILSEVAAVQRREPKRLLALLAVVPVLVGVAAAAIFGTATRDWAAAAETGWLAFAVAAAGGAVLAQGAGVGFALAYMLAGGLFGSLLAGAIGTGGLGWLRDAVVSRTDAGVTDAQVGIAYFTGLALGFVAGLKGLTYRRPPMTSIRQSFVSTSSLTTSVLVLIPLAAFVAFGIRAEHAAPAHLRDVFIGTVALYFFAAAVHWRTQRVRTTVVATFLALATYAGFSFAPWPSWDLISTGARSAIIWASFFSVGYSVLRDFLFPVGRGTRFEVDEGGVAALSVGFVVSLAGFSMVIAGATGDPFVSLVIGVGLIALGLAQRWWRPAVGSIAFAIWDLATAARTGRVGQHSAAWDEYHEVARAGLSRSLVRGLDVDRDRSLSYLAYFSRTAAAPATAPAWQRIATARAEACRSLDDIAALTDPVMTDVLREHAPKSAGYALVSMASRVADALASRDRARRLRELAQEVGHLRGPVPDDTPSERALRGWQRLLERATTRTPEDDGPARHEPRRGRPPPTT